MGRSKTVRVHLFKLETEACISSVLGEIASMPLSDRLRVISGARYRIEQIESRSNSIDLYSSDELLFFNVVKLSNSHSIGKASEAEGLSGIDYQGSNPSDDSVAIFDPATGFLLLESSKTGPRISSLEKYFLEISKQYVEAIQSVDKKIERKFQSQKCLSSFEMKINTSSLSEVDKGTLGLRDLLELTSSLDATDLHITISVDGRKKGGFLNGKVKEICKKVLTLNTDKVQPVSKLETKGFSDTSRSEVLDLLGAKLTEEVNVDIDPLTFRASLSDRWGALEKVYYAWVSAKYICTEEDC